MTTPGDGTQAADGSQATDDTQAADEQPPPGARLVDELRLLLDALAERAEPLLNRFAAGEHDEHEHTPATCGWCPVCAGMAVLRGERPELAVRAAEHAAGLLAVFRSALADPAPARPAPGDHEPTKVQHIPVRRRDTGEDGEC